jgi:hypothetical protein
MSKYLVQYVSPETGVRLREAGFPQPEPERGQRWHIYLERTKQKTTVLLFWVGGDHACFVCEDTDMWYRWYDINKVKDGVFLPNALEILEHLYDHSLSFGDSRRGLEWSIYDQIMIKGKHTRHQHKDNPAEAAAEAWIAFQQSEE